MLKFKKQRGSKKRRFNRLKKKKNERKEKKRELFKMEVFLKFPKRKSLKLRDQSLPLKESQLRSPVYLILIVTSNLQSSRYGRNLASTIKNKCKMFSGKLEFKERE